MVVKAVDFKVQLFHLLGLENTHLPHPMARCELNRLKALGALLAQNRVTIQC